MCPTSSRAFPVYLAAFELPTLAFVGAEATILQLSELGEKHFLPRFLCNSTRSHASLSERCPTKSSCVLLSLICISSSKAAYSFRYRKLTKPTILRLGEHNLSQADFLPTKRIEKENLGEERLN